MADNESSYEWELAGWQEAGESHSEGYHNVEAEGFSDWDFLPEADYAVLHMHDTETDEDFYLTLGGPFDDYEDFEAAIQEWYEEGS